MTLLRPFAFAVLIAGAAPAAADDIIETLDAAKRAYESGEISKAIEELQFAQGLLQAKRTESIAAFLPDPPAGWTREISTEMSGALMFAGGGIGAEGTYSDGSQSFTINLISDSPMIGMIGGMLSNPVMAMATGGAIERIGDIKVLEQEGSLSALVDDRVLIQAEGAPKEVMMPLIEQIDFAGLAEFRP